MIDADALPRHGNRGGLVYWRDIENAPTIDPVKHGRWLTEPYVGKHATLKVLRCSECDNPVIELPDGKDYNYCPNCGARMDGDDG